MREKYESLSVATLKELAKSRGMKGISALKKADLIQRMLQEDEKEAADKKTQEAKPVPAQVQKPITYEKPPVKAEEKIDFRPRRTFIRRNEEDTHRMWRNEEAGYRRNDNTGYGGYRNNDNMNNGYRGNDNSNNGYRGNDNSNNGYRGNDNSNNGYRGNDNSNNSYRRNDNDNYNGYRRNDGERTTYVRRNEPNTMRRNENIGNNNYSRRNENEYGGYRQNNDIENNSYRSRTEENNGYIMHRNESETNGYHRNDVRVENEFENSELDSGIQANGILEVMPDGYGFIRCENYLPGDNDVYVAPSQIRRFNLKTGDIITGNTRIKTQQEKFSALLYISSINGYHPTEAINRKNFEDLTPVFPNERLRMESGDNNMAMRIVDLVSPIGKGQRGMIVSPPKAGKTTLLKQMARSIVKNNADMHVIILLIDERPEEVTDIKEAIEGKNVEVIYSTFDELPEHHKRVSEMVIERAKRLVEHRQDVTILLDSITRLARAYNLTIPPSGRTLSGGLDPAALHMPKRFFGAARKMREGGSLTILATALVETGSKMDDVVYEEFKGTGNMELVLDRKLSEKRVFPALDITRSGTRREDLLLDREEQEAVTHMRRAINGMRTEEAVENILNLFTRTRSNREFVEMIKKTKLI